MRLHQSNIGDLGSTSSSTVIPAGTAIPLLSPVQSLSPIQFPSGITNCTPSGPPEGLYFAAGGAAALLLLPGLWKLIGGALAAYGLWGLSCTATPGVVIANGQCIYATKPSCNWIL